MTAEDRVAWTAADGGSLVAGFVLEDGGLLLLLLECAVHGKDRHTVVVRIHKHVMTKNGDVAAYCVMEL
jgi:hypothetical protein